MISTKEMTKLENQSVEKGISKLKLMENAGYGLYQNLKHDFELDNKIILIICGHGNNGGDGFVLARYLIENQYNVKILFLGDENKLKKESKYNYFMLQDKYSKYFTRLTNNIDTSEIIVDAMLGTGVNGKIREPYSSVIDLINKTNAIKITVDIPTGLNPDTGKILDKVVNSDKIYTFHDAKLGLKDYMDKVIIVDIGIK
jgi:hydroxyethylthiazole kinase-like uncharacterized protein yjeF